MAVLDSEAHHETPLQWPGADAPAVRMEVVPGAVRLVLTGVLTAAVSAAARELLLDACEVNAESVVLDLQVVLDPTDLTVLPHLVDVAERRCWATRRRLEVIAVNHEVAEALATAGIWSVAPPTT
jgi:anti-anti-sigma regulatory factor